MKIRVYFSPAILDLDESARQELLKDLESEDISEEELLAAAINPVELCRLHIEFFGTLICDKFAVEYEEPNGQVEEVRE